MEGYHDLARLKAIYPTVDVIITNGSEISDTTLNELVKLQQTRGLILFLDPDYQGERIRSIIDETVGGAKHAFLTKQQCISKNGKKVGIEHASNEDIVTALQSVLTATSHTQSTITMRDLRQWNLVGTSNAKQRRQYVTETLGIGLCNGKTLLHKCHMFNLSKTDIQNVLKEYPHE
ncbi:ribonuclease M5 [Candidatus Xianfuyuplasma coldseepsis]|uniref:Ribonuclease M5 n=1 Tax=Candidatus Xianfuyuplasma coldseepsis TaxID=2782163 RepID=A0A7L7KRC1_9MOLU|nr:ribonuclease M5 [Xianfuyuplasma coldseepsis]